MQWSHWFAGMMDTQPTDRMYDCLPMYHSVGGVQAPGAVLAGGGSVVIREKFSAQPVLERHRPLGLHAVSIHRRALPLPAAHRTVSATRPRHRIRMACGNGLRARMSGTASRTGFAIPHILEFYAATEGNVSLFNVEGEPGAIGRIPPYLAHRFPAALVKFDVEKSEPVRDEQGFCIRCAPNETGEAIGEILDGRVQFRQPIRGLHEPRGFREENPPQCL